MGPVTSGPSCRPGTRAVLVSTVSRQSAWSACKNGGAEWRAGHDGILVAQVPPPHAPLPLCLSWQNDKVASASGKENQLGHG